VVTTEGQALEDRDAEGAVSRTWFQVTGWVVLVAVLWGVDLLSKMSERDQLGVGKDDFRLISEQVTSALAVLILIPFVLRWLRLFPLKRGAWAEAVVGHMAGSVLFAFGHHVLMIVIRVPWYKINGIDYLWRDPFLNNLIVEYQKDIKVYFGIVVVATAYQMYCRSRPGPQSALTDRLVVQTGTADRILMLDQIDYLEAARNYVSVHADGREYIVRETMSNLRKKLPGTQFARTHRSFIVNVDKVREIRSTDSQQYVVLSSGLEIPLSRGYREEFRSLLSGLA
jgi:hypothetical protein